MLPSGSFNMLMNHLVRWAWRPKSYSQIPVTAISNAWSISPCLTEVTCTGVLLYDSMSTSRSLTSSSVCAGSPKMRMTPPWVLKQPVVRRARLFAHLVTRSTASTVSDDLTDGKHTHRHFSVPLFWGAHTTSHWGR